MADSIFSSFCKSENEHGYKCDKKEGHRGKHRRVEYDRTKIYWESKDDRTTLGRLR